MRAPAAVTRALWGMRQKDGILFKRSVHIIPRDRDGKNMSIVPYNRMGGILCMLIVWCLSTNPACSATITDEMGRELTLSSLPVRIVSLAPSITETLFALGLDREIVGVTRFSNYPEAVRSKPKVGSFIGLSLEKIVALRPDLVIGTADGNKRETIDQLAQIGIPVYITNPTTLEGIFETIAGLGAITGRSDEARAVVRELRRRVEKVGNAAGKRAHRRVFFQIGIHPIVSVGRGTLHDRLITLAGGINVAGNIDVTYPRMSIEQIIAAMPDIIIVSSMKRGGDFNEVGRTWERWKEIPAVKNNKVFTIDSDIVDHHSPRIVDGLEALAALIHPECAAAGGK